MLRVRSCRSALAVVRRPPEAPLTRTLIISKQRPADTTSSMGDNKAKALDALVDKPWTVWRYVNPWPDVAALSSDSALFSRVESFATTFGFAASAVIAGVV